MRSPVPAPECLRARIRACVCAHVRQRVRVHARVCVFIHACVQTYLHAGIELIVAHNAGKPDALKIKTVALLSEDVAFTLGTCTHNRE
jgi:hypothetical protein